MIRGRCDEFLGQVLHSPRVPCQIPAHDQKRQDGNKGLGILNFMGRLESLFEPCQRSRRFTT